MRPRGSSPTVISHRGASADAPENTLQAFELGFRHARWLETDVQPTSDDVPVLLHDDDLDRTTDGSGPVRETTYADLAGLDAGAWFSPQHAGARVPTLAALLGSLPHGCSVLLEIKGPHTDAQLQAVLEVVEGSTAGERVLLQSFERDELARLHRMRPGRPLGLLSAEWDADPVAECERYGAIVYNPEYTLLRDRRDELDRLHRAGIASAPYTADDPDAWQWLSEMGTDAIITNRPAALADWIARTQHSGRRPR